MAILRKTFEWLKFYFFLIFTSKNIAINFEIKEINFKILLIAIKNQILHIKIIIKQTIRQVNKQKL